MNPVFSVLARLSFPLIALILGISCIAPEPMNIWHPGNGTCFFGFVVDQEGVPVGKASIQITFEKIVQKTITDKYGRFAFYELPAGRYNVLAQKDGHIFVRFSITADGPTFITEKVIFLGKIPIINDGPAWQEAGRKK